ncbi:putative hypoxia induced protein [Arabidopsis thaliana]|uniref:F18C1.18 protein n=4 Tax=Arabidopsis TaxID=3701 RepID=Q9M9W0_ARATH|nr:Hypoxia-responsive family protein [Arabidopsis thaliana]KAG7580807.1 Hypoxia induced protein domain [Arabidopsis suecica]KAG7624149.1 Hypoxia induced protein domain [Arabidopsis thaliana x Arabidopsis arenosa]AAF26142.1 unknown protein [Arabidopsis thaliana]AEE74257.1 Hypoxia-responsive family protein [Arabidopsis thaliana]KAG7630151.1 Hypoxia induced protein domain [Arabidopsis suecica]|eukprot:NP_187206.1 Hypoxia-responsive family protein [Arabidopsis thaliana]
MVESKTKFEEIRKWVSDHKLRTVGCLWLSGITGSIAYNWSQPAMKTSVKIIHARLHAQALTLAALAGAAVVEYYDHKTEATNRYPKFLPPENLSHKD